MAKEPTFLSAMMEHGEIAKKLRKLKIYFDPEKCTGVWQCYEVCPMGRWEPDRENRRVIHLEEKVCIACGACVLQCPEGAIALLP
jgi:NAD-dependent dihydropyrimidine dehydrogenase PreA subunit